MLKRTRKYSLASATLFAVVVAFASIVPSTSVYAQRKSNSAQKQKEHPAVAMFMEAFKFMEAKKYKGAIKTFTDLKTKYNKELADAQKAMIDFQIATCYYLLEDWKNTETALKDFINRYPKGTEEPQDNKIASASISLADVYMRQKKWTEAREQLLKVRSSNDLSPVNRMKADVVLSDVIVKEAEAGGDVPKALATAESLLTKVTNGVGWTPEAIEARQRLVQVLLQAGKRKEAEALKNLIDARLKGSGANLDPASIIRSNVQNLQIGDGYFKQANDIMDDEAEKRDELYRRALVVYQGVLRKNALVKFYDPAIDKARGVRDEIEKRKSEMQEPNEAINKQLEAAQAELDELEGYRNDFNANKDYDALISFRLGACLFMLKRPWEAYVAFGDVVNNYPDFEKKSTAVYYYILTLRQMGRDVEAQKLCKDFLTKYKDAEEVGDIAVLLGQISYDRGEYKEAIDNFRWAESNVSNLSKRSRCEMDWFMISAQFARCPWGIGVKPEDVEGMGKPGYVPKLTAASTETIALIDNFIKKYQNDPLYNGSIEEMLYRKPLIYFYSGFYKETKDGLETYIDKYPHGQFIADARYRIAIVQFGIVPNSPDELRERTEDVIRRCDSWLEDFYPVNSETILNTKAIATLKSDLNFPEMEKPYILEAIDRQRPEVYTLMGDAYKRLAEKMKGSIVKKGVGNAREYEFSEDDTARKNSYTNKSIDAYIIAAKTSKNNAEALQFVLTELDKILPNRGEWDRLLDVYDTLYNWNPDAPRSLNYLYMKIRCTERMAKTPEERKQKQEEAKQILADAVLKNINDPRQDNVEMLITELAVRYARNVKKKRPAKFAEAEKLPKPKDPNEYTAEKAADELFAILKLVGKSEIEPTLIGKARGTYAKAEIYRLVRNTSEQERALKSIADSFTAEELSPTILGVVGDYLYAQSLAATEKGDNAQAKALMDKAETYYKYIIEFYRSANYADYGFNGYGQILLNRKEYAKAYTIFNDAISNNIPYAKDKDIRLGLSIALIHLSHEDALRLNILKPLDQAYEMLTYIGTAREWRGEATAAALYYKGLVEEKRGRWNEAVSQYRICYLTWKKYPEYAAKAMLNTGKIFEEHLNQKIEAAKIYEEMNISDSRFKSTPEAAEAARRRIKLPAIPIEPKTDEAVEVRPTSKK